MPISPLTDLYIDETYPRLVQTNDTRTEFADGLGTPITFGQTPTGSLLTTASAAGNTITFTKGDGTTFPITVNTGSAATITDYVTTSSFNAFTSSVVTTSSFNNYTGSTTSYFAGTSSYSNQALTASYASRALNITTTVVLDNTFDFPLLLWDITSPAYSVAARNNTLTYNFASQSINATASWAKNTVTSSYTLTASYTPNYVLNSATSSFITNAQTSSFVTNNQTSSFVTNAQTSSMLQPYVLNSATSSFVTNSQTSSFVQNSQTGSFLTTSSFNNYTGSTTSRFAGTASYATTASYALNAGGSTVSTASLLTTASVSSNTITFTKGDGSTFPIIVATGSGGGGGAAFPYTGSADITGSLNLVGPNTITLDNTDYTNTGGAGSHIALINPNLYGQNVVSSIIYGSTVAKWRTDYVGNISWVAGETGEHDFFTGGDYAVGSIKMRIFNNGNVQIATSPVGGAIADSGHKLDVSGSTRIVGNTQVVGNLDVTGSTQIVGGNSLAIGATYGGGIVAYLLQPGDTGYDSNYTNGFIAAPADLSTGIQWYNGSFIATGANNPAIGYGSSNTDTIVGSQGPTNTDYAAGLAYDYTDGTYSDWYLPSKDELNILYLNNALIGGFDLTKRYWSSTEADSPDNDAFAWAQSFFDGAQAIRSKDIADVRVRAIRSFSIPNVKLSVVGTAVNIADGQLNFPYISLDGGTSAFGLNYFQLGAREADTGIAAVFKCNGNPAGYGYNFQFVANQASNGLLIIGDNSTTSHIFATDAYPGGAGWPLKFRVANTNESWGAISDLMVLTPDQKVVVSGSLVLRTEVGTTVSTNYTIPFGSGTYMIFAGDPMDGATGNVTFPSVVEGANLTVIINSGDYAIVASPYPSNAAGADITELTGRTIWNFYGIDGKWLGGRLNNT